ncbi:MAG: hypothetical protein MZU79_02045 [Anaerotruncus sp.]|nr:hypothetical protein [Anaerotruncus sp.]
MIDTESLDTSKTYVGYEVGTNKIARKLQAYHCKPDINNLFSDNKPKDNDLATHVFAIVWNEPSSKWHVYESHFVYDGIRHLDFKHMVANAKKGFRKAILRFSI